MVELYDRFSSIPYWMALRVLRDPSAAEDLTQEVFLQLWRKPDVFLPGRGSFCGWLATVARNRAIDMLRKRKPEDNTDEVVLANPVNFGELAERACMMHKVQRAMGSLPLQQRRMLELAFFEGQTHTEITASTGVPLGTVKTRIRTALLTLRKSNEFMSKRKGSQ